MSLTDALKHVGREDLVKTASELSEDYTFGDRNATFISFVNGIVKGANDRQMKSCRDHARFWQINDECETAAQKLAAVKPRELQDQDYALLQKNGEATIRKYAAYDGESTVKAAMAFYDNRAKYPLAWRKTAAARILARAEKHGAHLPEYIETYLHKAAALGYPSPDSVSAILVQRLNATDARRNDEAVAKFASFMESMIDDEQLRLDHGLVKSAMETVENFDAYIGATHKYGEDFSLPEEIIDSKQTTEKLAKLAGISDCEVQLINGSRVDVTELKKEALAAVDPGLANMSPGELTQVLPTLPQGDADLLVRLT